MDTVDAVARAIFEEHWGGEPAFKRVFASLHVDDQDDYRRMARAAIDALSITNQCGAPGDTFECPACSADWVAVDYGPLDISWVRKDNTNE